ncbi:MAG: polysaccharide deacetylase family protein [Paludibacteraceae bacterium]|nr:polysaccharide deacetylase family protein [Paludibacteraceae bacterium]
MFVERPFFLLKWFYKGALWRVRKHGEKVIYLTFDDGPTPQSTYRILEILRRYNVKATFFCVGENVMKYPEVFEQIKAEGHAVGNHTFNHVSGWNSSTRYFMRQAEKADAYIHSDLFRPPYGHMMPRQLKELKQKYRIVLWDVITRDYNQRLSPKHVMRIVHWYSRNGSIVVFHDNVKAAKNCLAVLPEAIEFYKRKGYSFRLVGE